MTPDDQPTEREVAAAREIFDALDRSYGDALSDGEDDPRQVCSLRLIAAILARHRAAATGARNDALAGILAEVSAEVSRATHKFPTWPNDPLHAVAVVGEEAGELTKAVLQAVYEPHKSTVADVRMEAVQTAAMALRFLLSFEEYIYARSDEHAQAATEARDGR